MRRFLLAILFMQFFSIIAAQSYKVIDSLKQLFTTAKEDSNKAIVCYYLSHQYIYSYPDSALYYALQGLPLAQKLNFKEVELHLVWTIGEALSVKGNFSKGLEMQFKTLALAEKLNDTAEVAFALESIGNAYYFAKDYQKALFYYKEAITKSNVNPLENKWYSG